MKGAIELASHVTTVSETYAKEILDHHHGYGLDAHLRHHAAKLSGIVNGIDVSSYDPSSDPVLAKRYDAASSAAGKLANKMALAAETGLDPEGPLLACISRLTWQKGIDIIAHALPGLVAEGARVLFVGQGDPALERELREAEQRYPRLVATRVVFDPLLARRVFAGSDFLLVPSRYEPCGLTQMYAMRYGSLPIVTAVGGLKDTVSDGETGIVMQSPDPGALIEAGRRAVKLYRDEVARRAMITRAMARDSSWGRSAQKYLELYATLGEPP
jgi:starch synthase